MQNQIFKNKTYKDILVSAQIGLVKVIETYTSAGVLLVFTAGGWLVFSCGQNYVNWNSNIKTFLQMLKPGGQNQPVRCLAFYETPASQKM